MKEELIPAELQIQLAHTVHTVDFPDDTVMIGLIYSDIGHVVDTGHTIDTGHTADTAHSADTGHMVDIHTWSTLVKQQTLVT